MQTPATWRALARVGEVLPADVRVVILRAEGTSFSAGLDRRLLDARAEPTVPDPAAPVTDLADRTDPADLAALAALDDAALDAQIAHYQDAFSWWRRPGLVSVAAVQGHAVGAGFQLALACDLRVLADDARLSMREISFGLVPDLGGTKPLVDLVGYPRALEICVTGRWVGAAEAGQIGLAELVVPRGELETAVRDLVDAILSAPAGAVMEVTELLRAAGGRTMAEARAAERSAQARRLRQLALPEGEEWTLS